MVVMTVLAAPELVSATTDCILIEYNATAARALPNNNMVVANVSVPRVEFFCSFKPSIIRHYLRIGME